MRHALIAAVALTLGLPGAGLAGKKGKDKKDQGNKHGADVEVTVQFGSRDREVVREYFVEKHGRGKCPPGLAKKNNGCLPPGQAKKRYTVGYALPKGIETHPLPADLSIRIGAPPPGYSYFMVDGDVVKVAVGTMLVVDAIGGFVE